MQISKSNLFKSIFLSNWPLAVVSVLLAIFVSILEVASSALVLPLISILSSTTRDSRNIYGGLNINWLFERTLPEWHLPMILLGLLFITLTKNAILYGSSLSINAFMLRSGVALRQTCLERFLKLELPFYCNSGIGSLLGYVNDQAQRSEQLFCVVLEITREILFVTFLAIFLIVLSPGLTLISAGSLVSVAFLLKFMIKGVQQHGRKTAKSLEAFSSLASEILSGIRVIKSFSSEGQELLRVKRSLERRYTSELTAYKYNSAVAPLTETAGITVLLIIIMTGNFLLGSSSGAALPVLLTYSLALLRVLPRVNHLNGLRSQLSLLGGSFESIESFLTNTENQSLPEGKNIYSPLQSSLEFSQITFAYPDNLKPAINNISFAIPKGKITALVGQSGSGKSTVVDMLLRFYDPDKGAILIDGVDLRSFNRKSWHRAVSVVSQDTFLFNATVRENIAYGFPQATHSEIKEAAKRAYALEFIQALPCGFETFVGNRGTLLSGGQRQRIAIARAILCDPDILILDEATSALDTRSEQIVRQAIDEFGRNRTVLVIAHRLSTIEKADQIIVMHGGEIVEQGSHAELLATKGAYHSLHSLQTATEDPVSLVS